MYIKSKIVKCTLQNEDILHFIKEKFAYIKKKIVPLHRELKKT